MSVTLRQRSRQTTDNALSTGPLLQRKCGCGGSCASCSGKEELQRSARVDTRAGQAAPPIVHDVLRSSGEPLDRSARSFFEPKFGRDFSNVRVHRDAIAAESADAVDARAYTVGSHVVLGRGASKTTLAHELVHTVQQQTSTAGSDLKIGAAHDDFEQQADAIADSVMHAPASSGGAE
jgi:hypothetical protein